MKIAVYAICKNEEAFVERFMAPLKEADLVVVTDTGSTDNTVGRLREYGAVVHQIKMDPWRFDIPRNISLQMVPADIDVCVCIDLDEVLSDGWRKSIEEDWTPQTTRLRYQYIWNFLPDGRPGTTFWYDKIHLRHGFRWVKPVHEILTYDGVETHTYCNKFKLSHYPDPTKSRGSYLSLLELGCKEQPNDDRNSHYLGREYMSYHMYDKAIKELERHLSLPSAKWDSERAASMRYIARCYKSKGDLKNAEIWALKSCSESPNDREPWIELGKIYYAARNFPGTYYAMSRALEIKERSLTYISEPESWGGLPYDLASISAFNMGMVYQAVDLCTKAAELEPNDQRIRNNLMLLINKVQSNNKSKEQTT